MKLVESRTVRRKRNPEGSYEILQEYKMKQEPSRLFTHVIYPSHCCLARCFDSSISCPSKTHYQTSLFTDHAIIEATTVDLLEAGNPPVTGNSTSFLRRERGQHCLDDPLGLCFLGQEVTCSRPQVRLRLRQPLRTAYVPSACRGFCCCEAYGLQRQ